MNYKAYEPSPHSTLSQIKTLLEKEQFYQAWIVCSQYFMGLETNAHIRKALEGAAKDNVYNYLVKHINEGHDTKHVSKIDNQLEIYRNAEENLKKQGESYAVAKAAMEEFCADNNMDLNALVEQFKQKHQKLTREELIEKNKAVAERQAGKFAPTKDAIPMPMGEEYHKLMEEAADFNTQGADNLGKLIEQIENELEN